MERDTWNFNHLPAAEKEKVCACGHPRGWHYHGKGACLQTSRAGACLECGCREYKEFPMQDRQQ